MSLSQIAKKANYYWRKTINGEMNFLASEIPLRSYKRMYEVVFSVTASSQKGPAPKSTPRLEVQTDFKVAYDSPDHIVPEGSMRENATNKKFVLHMNRVVSREFPSSDKYFLDLGCSGGQLVADFLKMNWVAAGLEGSDYSLKHKRANWPALGGTNLFTCDLTKPWQMLRDGRPANCYNLITAWDVLEHIPTQSLDHLFERITSHLLPGGYFIASTGETSAIANGMEYHQTRWVNEEWKKFIRERVPLLSEVNVGLRRYQYVKCDLFNPQLLVYRKRKNP